MRHQYRIGVVIPALNEADAIAGVIAAIPEWADHIVVADNGSTDATPARARGPSPGDRSGDDRAAAGAPAGEEHRPGR